MSRSRYMWQLQLYSGKWEPAIGFWGSRVPSDNLWQSNWISESFRGDKCDVPVTRKKTLGGWLQSHTPCTNAVRRSAEKSAWCWERTVGLFGIHLLKKAIFTKTIHRTSPYDVLKDSRQANDVFFRPQGAAASCCIHIYNSQKSSDHVRSIKSHIFFIQDAQQSHWIPSISEAETNFDKDLQDMKLEKAQKEWEVKTSPWVS